MEFSDTLLAHKPLGAIEIAAFAAWNQVVAQVANLPYRRLPVGWALACRGACGLEIHDTAG
jgi:hypothetical protein